MVADFWNALEEVERVRMLGVLGLHELRGAFDREKRSVGDSPDEQAAHTLQAVWERSALAEAEVSNGHHGFNAQSLLGLISALDALVEEFAPAMRNILVRAMADEAFRYAEQEHPEATDELTAEQRNKLLEVFRSTITEKAVPKPERLSGSGINRYEAVLEQAGCGAPPERPIPDDLDQALKELGALRNVLMHRAARVDRQALKQAPSLPYKDGELVRISDDQYRTYSAAVRCYASEVTFRPMRGWPEASGNDLEPDLAKWRGYYRVGV